MKKILNTSLLVLSMLLLVSGLSSCGFFDDDDTEYEYGKLMVKIESGYNNRELLVTYSPYGLITGYTIKEEGTIKESYVLDYYSSFVRMTATAGQATGNIRDIYYDTQGRATTVQESNSVLMRFSYNSNYYLTQEIFESNSNPVVEYSYDSDGVISQIVQYDTEGQELEQISLQDCDVALAYNTIGLVFLDLLYNPYENYRPFLALLGIAGTLPRSYSAPEGRFSGFQYDAMGYISSVIMTVDGVQYEVNFIYDDEIE